MKSTSILRKLILLSVVFTIGIIVASPFMIGGSTPAVLPENNILNPRPAPTQPLVVTDKDSTAVDVSIPIYKETVAHIRVLSDQGGFADLITVGDAIQRQWGATGGERYGRLIVEFLGELTSGRILDENPEASDLAQEYAVAALKSADSYDLETEWALLRQLHYPVRFSNLDGSRIEQRRVRVRLWLHGLRRLEREKDKNFDPDETGPMKVEPPPGVNGFPGMAPERIKDPVLRMQYEEAIDKNNKRIRHQNHQLKLLQIEPGLVRGAVKFISTMYAQLPSDTEELTKLLAEHKISADVRRRIKSEIDALTSKDQY